MKAVLLAVAVAFVARHNVLALTATAALGAAVAGQVAYIVRKAVRP